MARTKQVSVADRLREAIVASGESLRSIGRETAVDHSRLSRFVRGERVIESDAFSRVCAYLGLELRQRRK